jgi:hypothetical protein
VENRSQWTSREPAARVTVLDLLKKAGNLRRGKVENLQAFVLEQLRLVEDHERADEGDLLG